LTYQFPAFATEPWIQSLIRNQTDRLKTFSVKMKQKN